MTGASTRTSCSRSAAGPCANDPAENKASIRKARVVFIGLLGEFVYEAEDCRSLSLPSPAFESCMTAEPLTRIKPTPGKNPHQCDFFPRQKPQSSSVLARLS